MTAGSRLRPRPLPAAGTGRSIGSAHPRGTTDFHPPQRRWLQRRWLQRHRRKRFPRRPLQRPAEPRRALGVCLCRDWTGCCATCWLSNSNPASTIRPSTSTWDKFRALPKVSNRCREGKISARSNRPNVVSLWIIAPGSLNSAMRSSTCFWVRPLFRIYSNLTSVPHSTRQMQSRVH